MNIEYCIISISEDRAAHKESIRHNVKLPAAGEIEFVNARDTEQLNRIMKKHSDITLREWTPKLGELGVWLSQVQCWDYAANMSADALIVFEDDALVSPGFKGFLDLYLEDLPEDWDFLSLAVPENQRKDFLYRQVYDDTGHPKNIIRAGEKAFEYEYGAPILARAYQGYCCVATMYSKQGAQKLLTLAKEYGMYTPVDCFLFLSSHRGRLNAFAPKPDSPMGVGIDWHIPTSVQKTDRFVR
jgi:GR25 family glycosyltransferase involved in LPS biosynthesis